MVLLVIIKSNHIISCKNVASSRSCSATRNFFGGDLVLVIFMEMRRERVSSVTDSD